MWRKKKESNLKIIKNFSLVSYLLSTEICLQNKTFFQVKSAEKIKLQEKFEELVEEREEKISTKIKRKL